MDDYQNRLTNFLLEKNHHISYRQARICIKILWNDVEAAYQFPYRNTNVKVVEKLIRKWIDEYGAIVHEFVNYAPESGHLFTADRRLLH